MLAPVAAVARRFRPVNPGRAGSPLPAARPDDVCGAHGVTSPYQDHQPAEAQRSLRELPTRVAACANSFPAYYAGVVTARLASLDQFRGYTVLGMCVVNFLGNFTALPAAFKHHNTYCSYADTIMPQFFFAVGFAYRLTFLRRMAGASVNSVCARFLWRNLKLILATL
mgnify:CR=1 FL=1